MAAELESAVQDHEVVITDEAFKNWLQQSDWKSFACYNLQPLEDTTYAPARKMLDAGMATTLTTDSSRILSNSQSPVCHALGLLHDAPNSSREFSMQ